jgi:hypothetical protein
MTGSMVPIPNTTFFTRMLEFTVISFTISLWGRRLINDLQVPWISKQMMLIVIFMDYTKWKNENPDNEN